MKKIVLSIIVGFVLLGCGGSSGEESVGTPSIIPPNNTNNVDKITESIDPKDLGGYIVKTKSAQYTNIYYTMKFYCNGGYELNITVPYAEEAGKFKMQTSTLDTRYVPILYIDTEDNTLYNEPSEDDTQAYRLADSWVIHLEGDKIVTDKSYFQSLQMLNAQFPIDSITKVRECSGEIPF